MRVTQIDKILMQRSALRAMFHLALDVRRRDSIQLAVEFRLNTQ